MGAPCQREDAPFVALQGAHWSCCIAQVPHLNRERREEEGRGRETQGERQGRGEGEKIRTGSQGGSTDRDEGKDGNCNTSSHEHLS